MLKKLNINQPFDETRHKLRNKTKFLTPNDFKVNDDFSIRKQLRLRIQNGQKKYYKEGGNRFYGTEKKQTEIPPVFFSSKFDKKNEDSKKFRFYFQKAQNFHFFELLCNNLNPYFLLKNLKKDTKYICQSQFKFFKKKTAFYRKKLLKDERFIDLCEMSYLDEIHGNFYIKLNLVSRLFYLKNGNQIPFKENIKQDFKLASPSLFILHKARLQSCSFLSEHCLLRNSNKKQDDKEAREKEIRLNFKKISNESHMKLRFRFFFFRCSSSIVYYIINNYLKTSHTNIKQIFLKDCVFSFFLDLHERKKDDIEQRNENTLKTALNPNINKRLRFQPNFRIEISDFSKSLYPTSLKLALVPNSNKSSKENGKKHCFSIMKLFAYYVNNKFIKASFEDVFLLKGDKKLRHKIFLKNSVFLILLGKRIYNKIFTGCRLCLQNKKCYFNLHILFIEFVLFFSLKNKINDIRFNFISVYLVFFRKYFLETFFFSKSFVKNLLRSPFFQNETFSDEISFSMKNDNIISLSEKFDFVFPLNSKNSFLFYKDYPSLQKKNFVFFVLQNLIRKVKQVFFEDYVSSKIGKRLRSQKMTFLFEKHGFSKEIILSQKRILLFKEKFFKENQEKTVILRKVFRVSNKRNFLKQSYLKKSIFILIYNIEKKIVDWKSKQLETNLVFYLEPTSIQDYTKSFLHIFKNPYQIEIKNKYLDIFLCFFLKKQRKTTQKVRSSLIPVSYSVFASRGAQIKKVDFLSEYIENNKEYKVSKRHGLKKFRFLNMFFEKCGFQFYINSKYYIYSRDLNIFPFFVLSSTRIEHDFNNFRILPFFELILKKKEYLYNKQNDLLVYIFKTSLCLFSLVIYFRDFCYKNRFVTKILDKSNTVFKLKLASCKNFFFLQKVYCFFTRLYALKFSWTFCFPFCVIHQDQFKLVCNTTYKKVRVFRLLRKKKKIQEKNNEFLFLFKRSQKKKTSEKSIPFLFYNNINRMLDDFFYLKNKNISSKLFASHKTQRRSQSFFSEQCKKNKAGLFFNESFFYKKNEKNYIYILNKDLEKLLLIKARIKTLTFYAGMINQAKNNFVVKQAFFENVVLSKDCKRFRFKQIPYSIFSFSIKNKKTYFNTYSFFQKRIYFLSFFNFSINHSLFHTRKKKPGIFLLGYHLYQRTKHDKISVLFNLNYLYRGKKGSFFLNEKEGKKNFVQQIDLKSFRTLTQNRLQTSSFLSYFINPRQNKFCKDKTSLVIPTRLTRNAEVLFLNGLFNKVKVYYLEKRILIKKTEYFKKDNKLLLLENSPFSYLKIIHPDFLIYYLNKKNLKIKFGKNIILVKRKINTNDDRFKKPILSLRHCFANNTVLNFLTLFLLKNKKKDRSCCFSIKNKQLDKKIMTVFDKSSKKSSLVLVINPTPLSIRQHIGQIRQIIHKCKNSNQLGLIQKLSPIIRNWCLYYTKSNSKLRFQYCDFLTFKMLWRWACRRHPKKSKNWIKRKYFKCLNGKNWVFSFQIKNSIDTFKVLFVCLPTHVDININFNIYPVEKQCFSNNGVRSL